MHVLRVAGIHYGDGVAVDGICEIPFVGVRHVEVFPSSYSGLAPLEGALYLVHGIDGVIDVLVHQFLGICMLIFLRDIAIERINLSRTLLFDGYFMAARILF